ncbi:dTDP-4-dehydrorhamnose reductase [Mucilaginibacter rubeus]|uniref:dTDP-4-dehydrorhamnose reductase n=1 Tax=Mucilaginibacter rubeus TaxID=2027860 RepID=A0AAE6JB05_9SPHI|nr:MULTISPECIES: dTDP-4-dehydrorhamnose reductase [Mucilaginibacter]QEM02063.1 dTDP-4-dehydrorhamnose reductase [Mucilaginibacter rubeus]QEM14688.1 dTDP-4-dehydrorhamnose reductase [Mucilaginibacter gossypii]QTE42604.1 dTDP-4-dehydrorhamnose reductase [Mucilaginibacter rubeus]QTE49205.1 dTDP-4-dehydrorhamnose reductase [Mucilaginibacter rubeus]QTE54302.1 dTDP-4-dehydrorhamnose reductase [Mucilaginibacter rubeus]
MQNIIVFGASGQLGNCLKKVAGERKIDYIHFLPEEEADILRGDLLDIVFEKYKPTFAINCAAYTAVDKAEDEVDLARAINKTGAANLATHCKAYGATLVQISTDFIFKGDVALPLTEEAIAEPISVYGLTKLEGEQAIAEILDEHYTIRTSWLYSEYGNNFVKTMLRLGADRDEVKVIADQVGTPTYAIDLAEAILTIITAGKKAYGIYHYSNEGVTSWYDFAKGIFDISGTDVKVLPIRTSEYPTNAQRPAYSVLDKAKIKATFNIEIPYWRDSLKACIKKLAAVQ